MESLSRSSGDEDELRRAQGSSQRGVFEMFFLLCLRSKRETRGLKGSRLSSAEILFCRNLFFEYFNWFYSLEVQFYFLIIFSAVFAISSGNDGEGGREEW